MVYVLLTMLLSPNFNSGPTQLQGLSAPFASAEECRIAAKEIDKIQQPFGHRAVTLCVAVKPIEMRL